MKIRNLRANQLWAIPLIVLGIGCFVGFDDLALRFLTKLQMGIDTHLYYTPHYDLFQAQAPVFGSILLVGGLILWFMPVNHEK